MASIWNAKETEMITPLAARLCLMPPHRSGGPGDSLAARCAHAIAVVLATVVHLQIQRHQNLEKFLHSTTSKGLLLDIPHCVSPRGCVVPVATGTPFKGHAGAMKPP